MPKLSLNIWRRILLLSSHLWLLSGLIFTANLTSVVSGYAEPESPRQPVARLNGESIFLDDVQPTVAFQIYRRQVDIYSLLKRETEELVDERLLAHEAARRQISVAELLRREIEAKVVEVSEADIDAYLMERPDAAARGPEVRPRIRHYLAETRKIEKRLAFLQELRAKAAYEFLLEPPTPPRVRLGHEGVPARGRLDAPVTLVHFATFSSPLSERTYRYLHRLTEAFPSRIRWEHRHFLNTHDEVGLLAAKLAVAAHEAGRFWEFHDRLFAAGGRLSEDEVTRIASEVGLDAAHQQMVRHDMHYLEQVKRDIDAGVKAGVQREPVIFVNGRYFSGTFPYDQLREVIIEELHAVDQPAASERNPHVRRKELFLPQRSK